MNPSADPVYQEGYWDGVHDQESTIEALRDLLAPLLNRPIQDNGRWQWCLFCHIQIASMPTETPLPHGPDCPVLRKYEILGLPTPIEPTP